MTHAFRSPSNSPRTTRGAMSAAFFAGGLSALSLLAGCQKTLFPTDLPRNQFETHDRLRQAYIPLEEPDVFGTPQPALRARLAPQ